MGGHVAMRLKKKVNFTGIRLTGMNGMKMLLKRLSMGELHLLAVVFDENVMSYESWKQLSSFGWKIATWVWIHYFQHDLTIWQYYDTMHIWLYHTTNNYFHNTQGKHGTFHATFWNKVTQRARYDVPPEEFDEVVKASRPLAEADPGWDAENGILTTDTLSFHW